MKTISLDIKLKRKQRKVFNLLNQGKFKEVLFYGSSRSGKTFVILYWLIVQVVVFGADCLVVRNLFTSLQSGMIEQTLPAVLNAIAKLNGFSSYDKIKMKGGKPFAKYNSNTNVLRFFNGHYIRFSSLRAGTTDTDNSYDKILSTEWGHIFADEVSEISEKSIDILRTRLAQRIADKAGNEVRNKIIMALNPTRKSGWTYVRYFKHENRDGVRLDPATIARFLVVHFKLKDNAGNISADYEEELAQMSELQRKRFLDGEYYDESEGEIFKKINWGPIPSGDKWEDLIIYTDPSAGESKSNDFKASVLLGKAEGKIYLIDFRAVQGSSLEMLKNIQELYARSPIPYITRIFMEKKQVPIDFQNTFAQFQADTGWICPLEWDTRNTGDKFTMIESTLDPLFSSGRFIFNEQLKDENYTEEAINQFLFFTRRKTATKDDIPDACAKGTSLLNRTGSITSGFKSKTRIVELGKRVTF